MVLSAIPTYTLASFKIPMSLCKRIQSALTRFWWDSNPEKRSMCWIAWDKMTKSKRDGGLGFRDIEAFNDAMLAKTSWRIISNPDCLLARLLKAKYCKKASFLEVKAATNISHGWRGILIGRDLLRGGMGYAVGDGKDARVWTDPWISIETPKILRGPATEDSAEWTVSELFLENTTDWDVSKIRRLFPDREKEILRIQPSRMGGKDRLIWLGDKYGQYSTKSGYYSALKQRDAVRETEIAEMGFDWNKEIWKKRTSNNIQMFLWKAKREALPVGTNLKHRKVTQNSDCHRCGREESTIHALFHCDFAKDVWRITLFASTIQSEKWTSMDESLKEARTLQALPPVGIHGDSLFSFICWNVWLSRNNLIFENRREGAMEVCTKAMPDAREWRAAQEEERTEELAREKTQTETYRSGNDENRATTTCYSDAAWKKETEEAGLGWIIGSTEGSNTHRRSARRTNVRSSLMAEALACLEALKNLRALNRNKVRMSSDSLNLIRALTKKDIPTELYGVIHDIEALSSHFEFLEFTFISRKDNGEADLLAKDALFYFNTG